MVLDDMHLSHDALSGRVAVITGAGRGLGKEVALALARLGARIIITEVDESGAAVEALIRAEASEVRFLKLDPAKEKDIRRLEQVAAKEYSKVDILVNNATAYPVGAFEEIPIKDVDTAYNTNVRAVLQATNLILPGMRNRKQGVIVTLAASHRVPFMLPYYMTSAALRSFAHTLSLEIEKDERVSVFSFDAGLVDTPGLTKALLAVAETLDLTFEDLLAKGGYANETRLSAEHAAAALAFAIVNAPSFHGTNVYAEKVLRDAGVRSESENDANTLPPDEDEPAQVDFFTKGTFFSNEEEEENAHEEEEGNKEVAPPTLPGASDEERAAHRSEKEPHTPPLAGLMKRLNDISQQGDVEHSADAQKDTEEKAKSQNASQPAPSSTSRFGFSFTQNEPKEEAPANEPAPEATRIPGVRNFADKPADEEAAQEEPDATFALTTLENSLAALKNEYDALGFIKKTWAMREFHDKTGMNHDTWMNTLRMMRETLSETPSYKSLCNALDTPSTEEVMDALERLYTFFCNAVENAKSSKSAESVVVTQSRSLKRRDDTDAVLSILRTLRTRYEEEARAEEAKAAEETSESEEEDVEQPASNE